MQDSQTLDYVRFSGDGNTGMYMAVSPVSDAIGTSGRGSEHVSEGGLAFAQKVADVVCLTLDPSDKALVLSVDEKSQNQALDRTQPGLPMKKGRAGTMTHDFKRHGTTTLFAALNVLNGKFTGQCIKRHRHQEFIRFLNKIDRQTPPYHSPDRRQLRHPQDASGQTVAEKNTHASTSTSPRPRRPGST